MSDNAFHDDEKFGDKKCIELKEEYACDGNDSSFDVKDVEIEDNLDLQDEDKEDLPPIQIQITKKKEKSPRVQRLDDRVEVVEKKRGRPVGCKDKTQRKRRSEAELEEDDRNGDMESPVKKGRITISAVHQEFEPVELFHKRLGKTVDGRRCRHCLAEFLCKNKSSLEDHIRVFHKDVYKRARGLLLYT